MKEEKVEKKYKIGNIHQVQSGLEESLMNHYVLITGTNTSDQNSIVLKVMLCREHFQNDTIPGDLTLGWNEYSNLSLEEALREKNNRLFNRGELLHDYKCIIETWNKLEVCSKVIESDPIGSLNENIINEVLKYKPRIFNWRNERNNVPFYMEIPRLIEDHDDSRLVLKQNEWKFAQKIERISKEIRSINPSLVPTW